MQQKLARIKRRTFTLGEHSPVVITHSFTAKFASSIQTMADRDVLLAIKDTAGRFSVENHMLVSLSDSKQLVREYTFS